MILNKYGKVLSIFLLLVGLTVLTGCYSFSATTLPSHIRTIYIHDVDNRTVDPLLGDALYASFREMFRKNASSVQLVNSEANADFMVTLKSYRNQVSNFTRSAQVETYQVTLRVDVVFKDNVKNEIIYQGKDLDGTGEYDIAKNESEQVHGQKRAIENLKDLVMNNAMSDW